MNVTLIITTYNSKEYLKCVLDSVLLQLEMPDEVVIADDGSSDGTDVLINEYKDKFNIPLIHSYHEDDGFRVARSRNLAISKSSGDYIILLDGDMLLPKTFISAHKKVAKSGHSVQGERIDLTQFVSKNIINGKAKKFCFLSSGIGNFRHRKYLVNSKLLSKVRSQIRQDIKKSLSCNMAFWREDFLNINGFDNNFIGWGGEDNEFVQRLVNSGVKVQIACNYGLHAFHIYHKTRSQDNLENNHTVLEQSKEMNMVKCINGFHEV